MRRHATSTINHRNLRFSFLYFFVFLRIQQCETEINKKKLIFLSNIKLLSIINIISFIIFFCIKLLLGSISRTGSIWAKAKRKSVLC